MASSWSTRWVPMNSPMAVADYKVLPPNLVNALPSPEYIVDRLEALDASIDFEPDEFAAHKPS